MTGNNLPVYENNLCMVIDLNGVWSVDVGNTHYSSVYVPSAWEILTSDKINEGPVLFRRSFKLQRIAPQAKYMLQASAISYACNCNINGSRVGSHEGLWSAFGLDVTSQLYEGENIIEIEVWKPGTRFSMRQCLAGFLPDVATTFGGIWQDIKIMEVAHYAICDLHMKVYPSGTCDVSGYLFGELIDVLFGEITVTCPDKSEVTAPVRLDHATRTFRAEINIQNPEQWLLGSANTMYQAVVRIYDNTHTLKLQVNRSFGFREIRADRERLLFNDVPVHLRGVLDWGWDAQTVCPTPTREKVLDQIAKARSLGFNMIKLCLFVPDEVTFDVADEIGMPLWLELPMWLPDVTPEFRKLALEEYAGILRRIHHHPSILIISLGCELNRQADASFLQQLRDLVHEWLPTALLCDNSGSAEAYGGVNTQLRDFYDYHFYTDPHFLPTVVDHFTRAYQQAKPWIYGEFCDADTLRDYGRLPRDTWWLTDDLPLQRDELTWTREGHLRLQQAGITDQGAQLTQTARRQATAIRKSIFEFVRKRGATGGYVITGWKDTPIATSGVVDDQGELKYTPAEWLNFNDDRILIIDRERRRRWQGGDRPVHTDPQTWWQDDAIELHIALSNGTEQVGASRLSWNLSHDRDESPVVISYGEEDFEAVPGGEITELTVLHCSLDSLKSDRPEALYLEAKLECRSSPVASSSVMNRWPLWAIPDKAGSLRTIKATRIYATLDTELIQAVAKGATRIVWLREPADPLTRLLPFWRESIHVFPDHPYWASVPHAGYADMRFYSVATDFALNPEALADVFGKDAQVIPIWRRFDARAMTWSDYMVEVRCGTGKLYISTLRFSGGLGIQPDSFETNPWGAWMLRSLIQC